MSGMELSVVILNWNTADFTIRSVTSLETDGVPRGRIRDFGHRTPGHPQ